MPKKYKLSPLARRLLRLVIAKLKKHPSSYDQNQKSAGCSLHTGRTNRPSCKSPVCVIGWMRHFARTKSLFPEDIGLTHQQQERLFWPYEWPAKFARDSNGVTYDYSAIPASMGIRRIEHFIKTDGRE